MTDVVGLDFDNTLVDYGPLFLDAAVDEGLLPAGTTASKQEVRDAIRALPDGEMSWRAVQARVYGQDIAGARLHPGATDLLSRLGRLGAPVYVVSHKTPTASYRGQTLDLHRAALEFLFTCGLFALEGRPLSPERVFFEPTRAAKARRIALLCCRAFVDDLPEVFLDASFPAGVRQLLYLPQGQAPAAFTGTLCRDWAQVARALLPGEPHA